MPLYEYLCRACGHKVEVLQKLGDKPLRDCEACHGKGKLDKMISRSSFQLKGGGWFSQGYGPGTSSSSSKTDSGSSTADKPEKKDKSSGTKGKPASD